MTPELTIVLRKLGEPCHEAVSAALTRPDQQPRLILAPGIELLDRGLTSGRKVTYTDAPPSVLKAPLFPGCGFFFVRRCVAQFYWISSFPNSRPLSSDFRLSIHSLTWKTAMQIATKTSKTTILPVAMVASSHVPQPRWSKQIQPSDDQYIPCVII